MLNADLNYPYINTPTINLIVLPKINTYVYKRLVLDRFCHYMMLNKWIKLLYQW